MLDRLMVDEEKIDQLTTAKKEKIDL